MKTQEEIEVLQNNRNVKIMAVERCADNKLFSIGDSVNVEDCFHGTIDGFMQFEDDFRVHLDVDDEAGDPEYWSLFELD